MTKDMTERQFKEALQRNGFRFNLLWMQDISGQTSTHFGVIADQSGKVYFRESLAHAIAARAKEVKQIDQAGKLAAQGMSVEQIAERLKIAKHSAQLYIGRAKNRPQIV